MSLITGLEGREKILAMPSVGVGAETHVAQRSQLFLEVGGFNQSSKDIEYGRKVHVVKMTLPGG